MLVGTQPNGRESAMLFDDSNANPEKHMDLKKKGSEKKPEGLKKARMTQVERDRQRYRTEATKARRAKAYAKRWAKRRALTAADPTRKGQSFARNQALRIEAKAHTIRRVQTVGGEVKLVKKPSVGLLKQRRGLPTQWTMPQGWSASPEAQ